MSYVVSPPVLALEARVGVLEGRLAALAGKVPPAGSFVVCRSCRCRYWSSDSCAGSRLGLCPLCRIPWDTEGSACDE